jgi:low affinity Fe/Cu permease
VVDSAVMNELFRKAAARVSCLLGSPGAFIAATALVVLWAACGPYFGYSDAWQLVINTSTTIGTFLMLFVLQNSQNRDTKAINIKLDELLRAIEGARNRLADLKDASDDELDELEGEFRRLARQRGQHIEATQGAASFETTPAAAARGLAIGKQKNVNRPNGKQRKSRDARR